MRKFAFTLIFALYVSSAHAQTQHQALLQFWEAQMDALALQIFALQEEQRLLLEEAELDKTTELIYRFEILEYYRAKLKGEAAPATISGDKVAFLGYSSNPFLKEGFDPQVLGRLLDLIKLQKPKALFFLGNLIWGLKLPSEVEEKESKLVYLPPEYDNLGNVAYQPSGIYSSEYFGKKLEQFSVFLKKHLGEEIPFYPIFGESEAIGPDSLKIFLEHFPIPNSVVLNSSQLVYTVTIGKAGFIAISFPAYDSAKNAPAQQFVTEPLLQWLGKSLAEQYSKSPFLFVLGNVPAFSIEGANGSKAGLDRDRDARTRFWQLLMRYKVLAYFSSNEPFYDRTYRYGVWQIITGGAGAEEPDDYGARTFNHYLLLTIPGRSNKAPVLEVFDINGKKADEETLSSQIPALYQFRQ